MPPHPAASSRLRICIVSDFFYPRLGGVELHQYQLAQALRRRGHHVIVVTGTYTVDGEQDGIRQGVRYLRNGLKVYYCPIMSLHQQASLPNLFCFASLLRSILLRERIQLVHGHQSTSALAHESLLHARTWGLPSVFTDHSLFSFGNSAAANLNKIMKFSLTSATAVICVSHCSKENLCLRAYLEPSKVYVIPNAVDTTKLMPDTKNAPKIEERFTIVVLSRLVYRKGMDLIIDVIPRICAEFPQVHFLIGGDGPKRVMMEEMREKYQLQDRVEMIGSVAHSDVRKVLTRGHLFLNCSLTEAFCIAILEAVSCGLYVVSTRVGGVPEILPEKNIMTFAKPDVTSIIQAVRESIPIVTKLRLENPHYSQEMHEMVREMYNWHMVAERTERVYYHAIKEHHEQVEAEREELEGEDDTRLCSNDPSSIQPDHGSLFSLSFRRLSSYSSLGIFAGWLFALVVILDHLLWRLLEFLQPRNDMDPALDFVVSSPDEEDESSSSSSRRRRNENVHQEDTSTVYLSTTHDTTQQSRSNQKRRRS